MIEELDRISTPMDEMDVATRLLTALGDSPALTEEERRGAFAEIEAFRFQRPHGTERRTWGIYWAELSSWVTGDGKQVHSPDVASVDDSILSHWIERSASATSPLMRARFGDLAWEIGRFLKGKSRAKDTEARHPISVDIPVSLVHRAIDAYIECVDRNLIKDEFHVWQFLDRAVELSATINDASRLEKAKTAFLNLGRESEKSKEKFLWWRFDDIAWERAKVLNFTPDETDFVMGLLERALARYSDQTSPLFDPHWAMDAADRIIRHRNRKNDQGDVKRVLKTAASAFEEAAKGASALVAVSWLEDLIPRYRNAGMVEDAARVEETIRDRSKEVQGEMKRVEVPISIPRAELDQWAERVAGATIDEGLSNLAMACLIREDSTRESIKTMLKNTPLLATIPSSILGTGGFTIAKVGSLADDLEGRTIQHAADLFNWNAPWLYFALNRIKEKYGLTIENLIGALAESRLFAEDGMPLVREGLAAWLAEDPVKAIHVLVPQIESALRNALAKAGASVVTYDPSTGGFKVIGMGAVLDHAVFRSQTLKDVRFHMRALFCDPRGINFRNHLAHGIAHPALFQMGLANWIVHAVLLVGRLRLQSK